MTGAALHPRSRSWWRSGQADTSRTRRGGEWALEGLRMKHLRGLSPSVLEPQQDRLPRKGTPCSAAQTGMGSRIHAVYSESMCLAWRCCDTLP